MDPEISVPAGRYPPSSGPSDLARTAQTGIGDIATRAKDKAQGIAQAAADAVDQNRGTAARVLANAASTIHDGATHLPGSERVTRLAEAAAEELDATAEYVREHTAQQIMTDLKQCVRRHPGASLLCAAVMGVLVGRGFRK
jgi:ABC-type transporter Mla subunit MlaD